LTILVLVLILPKISFIVWFLGQCDIDLMKLDWMEIVPSIVESQKATKLLAIHGDGGKGFVDGLVCFFFDLSLVDYGGWCYYCDFAF
jgi:hypothetical protein